MPLSKDQVASLREILPSNLHLFEFTTDSISSDYRNASASLISSNEHVDELRMWLRLTKNHPKFSVDGLSFKALALSRLEGYILELLLSKSLAFSRRYLGINTILAHFSELVLARSLIIPLG